MSPEFGPEFPEFPPEFPPSKRATSEDMPEWLHQQVQELFLKSNDGIKTQRNKKKIKDSTCLTIGKRIIWTFVTIITS